MSNTIPECYNCGDEHETKRCRAKCVCGRRGDVHTLASYNADGSCKHAALVRQLHAAKLNTDTVVHLKQHGENINYAVLYHSQFAAMHIANALRLL